MGVFLSGPAVDEEADGDEEGTRDHGGEAVFGFHFAFCGHVFEDFVGGNAEGDDATEGADADAQVGEADAASGEVVLGFEDFGYGCEEEEVLAVYYWVFGFFLWLWVGWGFVGL